MRRPRAHASEPRDQSHSGLRFIYLFIYLFAFCALKFSEWRSTKVATAGRVKYAASQLRIYINRARLERFHDVLLARSLILASPLCDSMIYRRFFMLSRINRNRRVIIAVFDELIHRDEIFATVCIIRPTNIYAERSARFVLTFSFLL